MRKAHQEHMPASLEQWVVRGLAAAAVVFAFGALTVVFRPPELLVSAPVIDDSFYAFTVARNIALGNGISVDGHSLTNGFQPLFTFLSVPCFWVTGGERIAGIRAVLVLQWAVFCTTAFVIGRIARDSRPEKESWREVIGWMFTVLYLVSFPGYGLHLNGLETGFTLFLEVLIWRFLQTNPFGQRTVRLGVLAGLLILSRIDTVFLVALLSLYFWIPGFPGTFRHRLVGWFTFGGIAGAVSAPWWLYNYCFFGSFMPTSGQAQMSASVSLDRLGQAQAALVHVAAVFSLPNEFGTTGRLEATGGLIGLAIIFTSLMRWGFLAWKGRGTTLPDSVAARTSRMMPLLAGAAAILFFWYCGTSFAFWHYERYYAPVILLVFGGAMAWGAELAWCVRRLPVASLAVVLLLSCRTQLVWLNQPTRTIQVYCFQDSFLDQYRLVRAVVPPDEPVAGAQTGLLGYFRDRVVNLDGKVNRDGLFYQPGNPPGRNIPTYLKLRDVRWFCDQPGFCTLFLGGYGRLPNRFGWYEYRAIKDWQLFSYREESRSNMEKPLETGATRGK